MRNQPILLTAILLALSLTFPLSAQAGKFAVINTGDHFYEIGDLDPELVKLHPDFAGWKMGYMCEHFGIMWADVWTWNCKFVSFQNNTYAEFEDDLRKEYEAKYSMSDTQRNIWNEYGIWMMVGLIGIGGVMGSKQDD